MRSIKFSLCLIFLAALLFSAAPAGAKEFSCIVQAGNTDVFVRIYDVDRDKDSTMRIWQGRLSKGESVSINTSEGVMTYYYSTRPNENAPMNAGNDRLCADNRTISVP